MTQASDINYDDSRYIMILRSLQSLQDVVLAPTYLVFSKLCTYNKHIVSLYPKRLLVMSRIPFYGLRTIKLLCLLVKKTPT